MVTSAICSHKAEGEMNRVAGLLDNIFDNLLK